AVGRGFWKLAGGLGFEAAETPDRFRHMTKRRLHESGTIGVDSTKQKFRVCLISEGSGSTAEYPREFFNQANAEALAGALSFPGHPEDLERPEKRNPMSAIGSIGDV